MSQIIRSIHRRLLPLAKSAAAASRLLSSSTAAAAGAADHTAEAPAPPPPTAPGDPPKSWSFLKIGALTTITAALGTAAYATYGILGLF